MHGDMVYAVSDFGSWVWDVLRTQTLVDGLPVPAAIIGAEGASGGNGDEYALRIAGIENNRVQAHAACARLPLGAGAVSAEGGEFAPVLAAVGRTEDSSVFDAGVNRVGIGERRLQMPHPLELPGMLRAVVPLVRGQRRGSRVVGELVAFAFRRTGRGWFSGRRSGLMPGFAAVVGALDELAKPSTGLRGVNAIGIHW